MFESKVKRFFAGFFVCVMEQISVVSAANVDNMMETTTDWS